MGDRYWTTLDLPSRTFQKRINQIFLSSERISLFSTNRSAGWHWEMPNNADATRFSDNISKSGYIFGGWLQETLRRIVFCARDLTALDSRRREQSRYSEIDGQPSFAA